MRSSTRKERSRIAAKHLLQNQVRGFFLKADRKVSVGHV